MRYMIGSNVHQTLQQYVSKVMIQKMQKQYGFRFTGPDQWAHGEYHTSQKARQWALDLVKDSISHQRTASWNGIELLNYPSMTTHEILTRRVKDYNLDHPVHADRKKFLDNYWYQIMNS